MTHAIDPAVVERAAEAIWNSHEIQSHPWSTVSESTKRAYRKWARAALASIPEAGEEAVRAEREAIADMADQYAMNIRSQIRKVSESDTVNSIDASAKWNRATALEDFAFCVRARTKDNAHD